MSFASNAGAILDGQGAQAYEPASSVMGIKRKGVQKEWPDCGEFDREILRGGLACPRLLQDSMTGHKRHATELALVVFGTRPPVTKAR